MTLTAYPLSKMPEVTLLSRSRAVFFESYPHVMAGQQRTILSLMESWRSNFGDCVLVTPFSGSFVEEAQRHGFECRIVPYSDRLARYGGAIYRDGLSARIQTWKEASQYILRSRRWLRECQPDVLYCNDLRGLLTFGIAARTLGIPVLIWDKLDKPHGLLDWLQLPVAERNLIISQAVSKKYPGWQNAIFKRRIRVVLNGADYASFDCARPIRDELGLLTEDLVIGIVGTVTHRKGHDRLLHLVPQLCELNSHIRIVIFGSWTDSQEDRDYYERLPNRCHPRVEFFGYRGDSGEIMKSLDILVVASRHEGMGQVTVEAMACCIPVVGARAGGIPEVVEDGVTGLLFDGDDSNDLFKQLSRLVNSPQLCEEMGNAGRKRVEEYFDRSRQMHVVCEELSALAESKSRR